MDFFPENEGYAHQTHLEVGFAKLTAALQTLHNEIQSQGRRLVIVYAPSKEEAYRSVLENQFHVSRNRIPSFSAPLAGFCQAAGIDMLDLTVPFVERANAGEFLYFQFDGHWTTLGHQLAAEHIHRYLTAPRK
jgi:hypothetical protein